MGFIKEFKEFAMRGNMIDLAVGLVMGTAFSGIVNSLVNDVIMPVIGALTRGVNVSEFFLALNGEAYASVEAAKAAGAPLLTYGNFLQMGINFLLIAVSLFVVVKGINKLRTSFAKEEVKAAAPRLCPFCCETIAKEATRCPHCTAEIPQHTDAL